MRMSALDWYQDAWHNYANFAGRSQRAAYWYFFLIHVIVAFVLLFLDVGVLRFPFLTIFYYLATIIPGLSLTVRRLHDVGVSGWFLLVVVIPVVGGLILFILLVQDSTGGNQYGPRPKSTAIDPMGGNVDDDGVVEDFTGNTAPDGFLPTDDVKVGTRYTAAAVTNDAIDELPSVPDFGADDTVDELPSDSEVDIDEPTLPIHKDLARLEEGTLHRFAYWPTGGVPQVSAGVYTIWRGAEFIYVGIAGHGNVAEKAKAKQTEKPWGLQVRLNSHASGRRSDDQLCMSICDRFVIPALSSTEAHQVESEDLSLDVPTRQFIRKELSFRFMETPDGNLAANIARVVRQGRLRAGKPLLNPLALSVERYAEKVAELQAFKKKHGHYLVPRLFPENPELSNWVRHLRSNGREGYLTKYPILCWRLDKLGFNWDMAAYDVDAPLVQTETDCPECGTPIEPHDKFCSACGHIKN